MSTPFELGRGLAWTKDSTECTLVRLSSSGGILTGLVRRGDDYEEIPLADLACEVVLETWASRPDLVEHADDDWLLASLPTEVRRELAERVAAVIEVTTGFAPRHRMGQPPRPEYDLNATTLTQRVASKALERKVSTRTVHRWVKDHERGGAVELLHGNRTLGNVLDLYPPEVVTIARGLAEEERTRSSKSLTTLIVLLNQRLVTRGHAALSVYKATNLLNEVSRGMSLRGTAKTSRSKASRPKGGRGYVRPTVANEVWEIDSTQMDILVYSPLSKAGIPVYGIFIIDQCTRLLSVYLTLSSPSATSVALALHRRMNPLLLEPTMIPVGPAIPAAVMAEDDSPLTHPGGVPGELHIDHGREYENEMILSLLASLGIDLIPARPRTGADKPHIESGIRTVNHTLMQLLPGYKGHSADHRGEHPDRDALVTLAQLRSIVDGYCMAYNNHPHTGLVHPAQLGAHLTPMQAYTASILAGAPPRLDADVNLIFRFLPTKNAVVTGRGPTIDNIVYNSDNIDVMRRLSAGERHIKGRRLAFHYDPSDRSQVYWHEPGTARWHTLYAVGNDQTAIPPLSDEAYQQALDAFAKRRPNKQDRATWSLAIADYVRNMLSGTQGSASLKREFNRYQERLSEFARVPATSTATRPRTNGSSGAPAPAFGTAEVIDLRLDAYVDEIQEMGAADEADDSPAFDGVPW